MARAAPRAALFARIERALLSNWFVWLGGALIALAIVSLLRFAINAHYFGPAAQLACAYVLGAALLGAAEWSARSPQIGASALGALPRLPAILAATGLFAWFMATLAGYAGLKLIGVGAAFALMALSALAAIMAALRYGKWLAALGLGGGYLAPALVHFSNPSPSALFGYLLALTASALAVIRLRRWRGFVWLTGGGALAWGLVWAQDLFADAPSRNAAGWYVVALAALGFVFAWSDARGPLRLESWRALRAGWSEPVLAAHVLALAAAGDLYFLAIGGGYEYAVLAAIVSLCVLTCLAAYARESFALLSAAAVALAAATIWSWPGPGGDADAAPAAASTFFLLCGAFGFIFSAGGWLMMTASRAKAPGAALAALGPMAMVLVSHERAAVLRDPLLWSAAAILLAALDVFALERIAKAYDGVDKAKGPSAAFALGAAAGLILGIVFGLGGQAFWGPAALALLAPAMAWLDLRFGLPALRLAGALVAALVVWDLGPSLSVFAAPLARTPVFNSLLPAYAAAAAALWGAGALYRRGGVAADARIVQTLEAGALIVAAFGASLEIRHLATGGDLGAAGYGLAELSGDVIAWLGLALGLAARFGPRPRGILFFGEAIAFAAAAALALLGAGLAINPWWGWAPAAAPGWPIVNLLLAAFGLPAALFAIYAIVRRRQGLAARAEWAGAIAITLAFLNVTLEVRRLYHPADMSGPDISQWEAWSYTAAWIALAAALLALGLMRRQPSLRYASLIVLLAAVIKAFGFDIHALNGVLLAAQLLGLGVAVLGVTLIYQRFVAASALRADADPNLIPPA